MNKTQRPETPEFGKTLDAKTSLSQVKSDEKHINTKVLHKFKSKGYAQDGVVIDLDIKYTAEYGYPGYIFSINNGVECIPNIAHKSYIGVVEDMVKDIAEEVKKQPGVSTVEWQINNTSQNAVASSREVLPMVFGEDKIYLSKRYPTAIIEYLYKNKLLKLPFALKEAHMFNMSTKTTSTPFKEVPVVMFLWGMINFKESYVNINSNYIDLFKSLLSVCGKHNNRSIEPLYPKFDNTAESLMYCVGSHNVDWVEMEFELGCKTYKEGIERSLRIAYNAALKIYEDIPDKESWFPVINQVGFKEFKQRVASNIHLLNNSMGSADMWLPADFFLVNVVNIDSYTELVSTSFEDANALDKINNSFTNNYDINKTIEGVSLKHKGGSEGKITNMVGLMFPEVDHIINKQDRLMAVSPTTTYNDVIDKMVDIINIRKELSVYAQSGDVGYVEGPDFISHLFSLKVVDITMVKTAGDSEENVSTLTPKNIEEWLMDPTISNDRLKTRVGMVVVALDAKLGDNNISFTPIDIIYKHNALRVVRDIIKTSSQRPDGAKETLIKVITSRRHNIFSPPYIIVVSSTKDATITKIDSAADDMGYTPTKDVDIVINNPSVSDSGGTRLVDIDFYGIGWSEMHNNIKLTVRTYGRPQQTIEIKPF